MSQELIQRLEALIPDLEDGRETHRDWRDCHQKYRDKSPDIGDKNFHARYVLIYDERISAVKEAIEFIKANT